MKQPEIVELIGAVLIRSPYGEIWVCFHGRTHERICQEEALRPNPRLVLTLEQVKRLRGKSEAMIRASLAVLAAFPGSRIVDKPPPRTLH